MFLCLYNDLYDFIYLFITGTEALKSQLHPLTTQKEDIHGLI